MIQITIDGDTALMKRLEEDPQHVVNAFVGGANDQVDIMADQIRANVSGGVLQTHTGKLEASVHPTEPVVKGMVAEVGIIGAEGDAFYGVFQETGTENPYPEEAHAGGVMAFTGNLIQGGTDKIFTKLVEHPALPERPWFMPVLDHMAPQVVDGIAQAIQEVI